MSEKSLNDWYDIFNTLPILFALPICFAMFDEVDEECEWEYKDVESLLLWQVVGHNEHTVEDQIENTLLLTT